MSTAHSQSKPVSLEISAQQRAFHLKTECWCTPRAVLHRYFNDAQIAQLHTTRTTIDPRRRTVVLCSLENPLASLGGLGTVCRFFPKSLAEHGEKVLFLTPLHRSIPTVAAALRSGRLEPGRQRLHVQLPQGRVAVSLFRDREAVIPVWYLSVEGFFTAAAHPYDYPGSELLLRDSLLFSAIIPAVAARLGVRADLVFHLHDWESALVALTVKQALLAGVLRSAACVLTLHNSFDHPLTPRLARQFVGPVPDTTVLHHALPLLDAPLTTVSQPFAQELMHEPLQREYFAPHLQPLFSANAPIGIEHGPFGAPKPVFTATVLRKAAAGDFRPLIDAKDRLRTTFERCVTGLEKKSIGTLRAPAGRSGRAPVFYMTGRMDLRQKGYDIVFEAFMRLARGRARLLFSPSNPDAASLSFFSECARKRRGDIMIVPGRLSARQFASCIKGVSWLVMPSLYEPFGAANEAMLSGTPVIARATGGLWSQVCSLQSCPVPRWYHPFIPLQADAEGANGILFRESGRVGATGRAWRKLMDTAVGERMQVPLYRAMVDAAFQALELAIETYADPSRYAALIVNGLDFVQQRSWDDPVARYRTIYDLAGSGR